MARFAGVAIAGNVHVVAMRTHAGTGVSSAAGIAGITGIHGVSDEVTLLECCWKQTYK